MKNKKAWIQIVEATVSMLILFGLTLGLIQQQIEKPDIAKQVYNIQHQILTEAQDDYCIRNEILSNNYTSLSKFISKRLCTLPYNFTINLCKPTEACLFPDNIAKPKTDIYADNMIIAANLTSYNPVKIAFFAWQGSTQCETYKCVMPGGIVGPGGCTGEWPESVDGECAKRCFDADGARYRYYLFKNSCPNVICDNIGYDSTANNFYLLDVITENIEDITLNIIPSDKEKIGNKHYFFYTEESVEQQKIDITIPACAFSIKKY